MSIDITHSEQINSFPMSSDAPNGCSKSTQPSEKQGKNHPKSESTEQQLIKYLQESKGAFYGHANTLLSRQQRNLNVRRFAARHDSQDVEIKRPDREF